MRENLYLNHVVPECKSTKRGTNAKIDLKKTKYPSKLMCTVVFFKERDKILFLNEPKQTELAKQKHGVTG